MQNFTPFSALVGGLLIGLSTSMIWLVNGRATGISGIAGGIFPFRRGDIAWRVAFVVAVPVGCYLGFLLGPLLLAEIPATRPLVSMTPVLAVAAGLLAGIGTRLGRGCTSGHGICGLARLSPRSGVAVATFMVTAAVTVFVARHVF